MNSELYNFIWERCEADDKKTKEILDKIKETIINLLTDKQSSLKNKGDAN